MKKQKLTASSHLICIFIVAVVLSAGPAFGQLIVQPMRLDLYPTPGKRIPTKIELQNWDPNTHEVELRLVDLAQEENGSWRVIEPNDNFDTSQLSSCKDWITMPAQRNFEIRPLRIVPVPLTLRIPPRTRGFYGAGIVVAQKAQARGGVNMAVNFLVPIILEIQQGRAQRHGVELQGIGMTFSEPNGLNPATTLFTMDIENKGGTFSSVNAYGRIRYFSSGHWRDITTTEFRGTGIIPGAKLSLKSNIGRSLPSGKYRIAGAVYVDGRLVTPMAEEINFVGDPSITKAAGDVGLTVDPTEAIIDAVPGATRNSVLRVRNDSDELVNVVTQLTLPPCLRGAGVGDFVGDELDCSGWLKLMPEKFKLRSSGRQNIRITAQMPKSTKPHACYYALLSMYATYPDGQNAGVRTAYVCVRNNNIELVAAAQPAGRINIAALEGSKHLIVARFGNYGNTHFTPRCIATITRISSGVSMGTILLSSSSSGVLLPFEHRGFSGVVDFKDYSADQYNIFATLQYAPGEDITQNIPILVSIKGDQRVVDIIQAERPGEKAEIELNR